ncbi:MAG: hypothetical protein QOF01_1494 [Thermomicrobiales bacterium]|jgi:hypothetical protein|nr:hypothetical protein [Thermomicrobiales bacterium]
MSYTSAGWGGGSFIALLGAEPATFQPGKRASWLHGQIESEWR